MEKEAAAIDTRDPLDNLVFKSSITRSDMLFITLINSMFNSLKFIELRCFLRSTFYHLFPQRYNNILKQARKSGESFEKKYGGYIKFPRLERVLQLSAGSIPFGHSTSGY